MPRFPRTLAPALVVVGFAAPALAQNAGPQIDFYGQINLGILSADDGVASNSGLTDNDNSNSRVGVIYTQPLNNGAEFRLHFETALGFTGSSSINGAANDFDLHYRRTELRKFEAIYVTPSIGTFSFGQGSIATDGSAEADFSGTGLVIYSGLDDLGASQELRLSGGALSGVTVGSAFSAFDGGRRFRVRYDTPSFNGFGLAVSAGEEVLARGNDGEFYDIGLKYDRDYGDIKVASRLGYSWRDSTEELLVGSVALLHKPTGLNLALASGAQQVGDASYVYAKLGIQRDWVSWGSTAISVDVYQGDNFGAAGADSRAVGIGLVQKVDAYDLELYAGHRRYEYARTGIAFRDLDVTMIGARWKF